MNKILNPKSQQRAEWLELLSNRIQKNGVEAVCIVMHYGIFASGPLFTETTRNMFELNWFNIAIATAGTLKYQFRKT